MTAPPIMPTRSGDRPVPAKGSITAAACSTNSLLYLEVRHQSYRQNVDGQQHEGHDNHRPEHRMVGDLGVVVGFDKLHDEDHRHWEQRQKPSRDPTVSGKGPYLAKHLKALANDFAQLAEYLCQI